MKDRESYGCAVYQTRFNGLVRWVDGVYVFVEKPDCPGLDIGDDMPKEWHVTPANERAREAADEAREFELSLNEFFDLVFEKVDGGDMTLEQVGDLFPKKVRDCS